MSRAINGSAPLIGTWVAVAAIIALHWIVSYLSSRVTWFGPMLKGKPIEIIRDGEVLRDGLKSAKLSFKDLDQAFRAQSKQPDPSTVQRAQMEPDGSVSMIPKPGEPKILEVQVENGVQTVRIAME